MSGSHLGGCLAVALALSAGCHGAGASDSGVDSGVVTPADAGSTAADAAQEDGAPGDASTSLDAGAQEDGSSSADAALGTRLTATLVDTRFHVAEHMRAAIEMQISGEPFAQLLGYSLPGFNRQLMKTDQYQDPATGAVRTDPLGYALAVESYEYSKQPMNNLSFESGAGLSLMFGPILNPGQMAGGPAFHLLVDRFQLFARESASIGIQGQAMVVPPPAANPLNYYGWPGLRPVFAEFASFDTEIHAALGMVRSCYLGGAFVYGPMSLFSFVAGYECDYNSLNLPNREAQVTKTLDLGGMGYAVWKQGLWSINYWGTLHDLAGNGITVVTSTAIPLVGMPGNSVVGSYPDPMDPTGMHLLPGATGTYLGDIPIEGWQGLLMMEEIDNKSALLLGSLLTGNGSMLGGASSIRAAIDYSYDSPLLFFPALVDVTETETATTAELANKYFPQPTGFSIHDGSSRLGVLSGLIGGYAEAFAFTDRNNPSVGGSVPFLATFDGDPFPQDDGMPDGESTLHDRALAVLKIALVDLDRLHFDPSAKVLVDAVDFGTGAPVRGTYISTVEAAEAILALRNAFRSLNGSLQLYSNDTPDTLGRPAALDAAALGGAPFAGTLESRITDLIRAEADFMASKLIDQSGAASNGWDLALGAVDPAPATLESEAAAIRGLLEAYLATSDQRYRTRAMDVYADLERRFWMEDVRTYRTTAGIDGLMQYTPLRFGLLQGALRQYYKLVASGPGHQAEGASLLSRIKRTIKLVLNGWDDRNQDDMIQYPDECLLSGLEMAERALTAELGHPQDMGDREHDCIREVSAVGRPAALAAELDLSR